MILSTIGARSDIWREIVVSQFYFHISNAWWNTLYYTCFMSIWKEASFYFGKTENVIFLFVLPSISSSDKKSLFQYTSLTLVLLYQKWLQWILLAFNAGKGRLSLLLLLLLKTWLSSFLYVNVKKFVLFFLYKCICLWNNCQFFFLCIFHSVSIIINVCSVTVI